MVRVLFDTNIPIDHLLKFRAALDEIIAYEDSAISSVSWIELACKMTAEERRYAVA